MTEPTTVSAQDRLISYVVIAAVVIGAWWFLFGRGGSTAQPEDWSKPYEQTTCADWSDSMADRDRYVMAAVMLQVLQRLEDLDADPSYNKSSAYKVAITTACAGSPELVFTVSDQVYDADPRFGP